MKHSIAAKSTGPHVPQGEDSMENIGRRCEKTGVFLERYCKQLDQSR